MSSLWNHTGATGAASVFPTTGTAPRPGGFSVAKAQQAGKQAAQGATQPGLSAGARGSASPLATSASTAATTSANSADSSAGLITANDFLSLLVTEMQNQDPTADTDPNAYIDQLVQINSLEQLISINQNLTTVLGTATSPVTPSKASAATQPIGSSDAVGLNSSATRLGTTQAKHNASNPSNSHAKGVSALPAKATPSHAPGKGNLSLPKASAASQTVAHALDGRSRGLGYGHGIRDIPTH